MTEKGEGKSMTYSERQIIEMLQWIHNDMELACNSDAFVEDCLEYLRIMYVPTEQPAWPDITDYSYDGDGNLVLHE